MAKQPATVRELADMIDPDKAQLFAARVLQILGSATRWGGDQVSYIDGVAAQSGVCPDGVPRWSDQTPENLEFWENL